MGIEKTLSQLSGEPKLWSSLQKAGFYLIDFVNGFAISGNVLTSLGYSSEDLNSGRFTSYLHPEDVSTYQSLWERVLGGWEDEFVAEYRIRDKKKDDWCWVQSNGIVLSRSAGGGIAVYAGIDKNITARKEAEAIARKHTEYLSNIFDQAETLRVVSMLANSTLDPKKTISIVLEQGHHILPFQRAAVSCYRNGLLEFLGCELENGQCESPLEHPPSHPIWGVLELKVPAIKDDLGSLSPPFPGDSECKYRSWMGIPLIFHQELLGVLEFWHTDVGFFRSEQVWPSMSFGDSIAESLFNGRKYATVYLDSRTDPLTGLFSRRDLQVSGPELLERSGLEGRSLSVLMLDIDHFKEVNDNYGHLVGDGVLLAVAQLCKNLLRQDDLFFRYGGEEFLAFLPDTDRQVAQVVAERLRDTVSRALFRGFEGPVTVSIGIASVAQGNRPEYETLILEADKALYEAKRLGRNRVATSPLWATPLRRGT